MSDASSEPTGAPDAQTSPVRSAADEPFATKAGWKSRLRPVIGALVLILVLALIGYKLAQDWDSFVDSIRKIGVWGVLLSVLCGLFGIFANFLQWRSVVGGLGVEFGVRDGSKVFFVSQLGKYLPGSVWPVVMQMEAGKQRGANRKTMIAGNLITVVLSVSTGIVLAGLLLPFSYPSALHRFWWALAALPLVLLLAHPKSLPYLLDRLLSLLHRAPLGVQLSGDATLRASGWSTVSWVGQGLSLAVLVAAIGKPSVGLFALCIGGMGLAVSAGVLFIPAPAGAGLREVVLGYVLVAVITDDQAVAVVIVSRVLLIVVDLLLALGATVAARGSQPMTQHAVSLPG